MTCGEATALLLERVLYHFSAELFGVGKVRGRKGMPEGQVADQLGQSATWGLHHQIDLAVSDRLELHCHIGDGVVKLGS